jgi:hypothetical protein
MALRISGHSDDIVEVKGCGLHDEISASRGVARVTVGTHAGGIVVTMKYGAGGTWVATLSQVPDGDREPQVPWPVLVSSERYSIVIVIDCPDDTPVVWRGKRRN